MLLKLLKRRTVFAKVFLFMTLLSVIAGGFVLGTAMVIQTDILESHLIEDHVFLAGVAAQSVEAGYLAKNWPFKTLKQISDCKDVLFLWVVKPDGEISFADDASVWGKKIDDKDVGAKELTVKDSLFKSDEKIKLVIHPLEIEDGEKPWSLYMGVSLASITEARNKMLSNSLGFFFIIIIAAALLSLYSAKSITEPIKKLVEGTAQIGKGKLNYKITIKSRDEIGQLADSFNKMAVDLRHSRAELEKYSKTLERKVRQRTRQLEKRNKELDRFNKIAVGRELKMVELKKKIKKLESKVEEDSR